MIMECGPYQPGPTNCDSVNIAEHMCNSSSIASKCILKRKLRRTNQLTNLVFSEIMLIEYICNVNSLKRIIIVIIIIYFFHLSMKVYIAENYIQMQ